MILHKYRKIFHDGGGFGDNDATLIELCLTDKNRHLIYVTVCHYSLEANIYVTPFPIMDLVVCMASLAEIDWEYELKKIENIALEKYEYSYDEIPESLGSADFENAIQIARSAMNEYFPPKVLKHNPEAVDEFLNQYIDKEIG